MEITEKNNPIRKCIRCNKEVHIGNMFGFDGEVGYCLDCYIGGGLGSAVLDHSYRPIPIFSHLSTEKPNKKEKLLYMGIELEIEHRTTSLPKYAYELQKRYPIYVKHDGSLRRGIEIVSHPQTAKHHQKIFKWYELLSELRADHWTSYDNGRCGLHIHVNKNFFDRKDEILKIVFFHHKCFDKLRQFTKRNNTMYCQRWSNSLVEMMKDNKGRVRAGAQNDARHSCINLQNEHTVEFRMYRGTLNYDRFLASILFTDAICSFVRNYSVTFFVNNKHKGVELWNEFIKFVDSDGRYDFLRDYCKRHKLDDAKRITLDIPPYEDYISKKQIEFITMAGSVLKEKVQGTGIEKYIIEELSYEFIKREINEINFLDANNYIIYTKGSVPKWAMPKELVRLKLEKRSGVSSPTMAGIIRKCLELSTYYLRVIHHSNGRIFKEVTTVRDLFKNVIGAGYDNYNRLSDMEEIIKTFIVSHNYKYELIRSDAVGVYNSS